MAAKKTTTTTKTATTEVSKASDEISRFRLGELGSSGIPIFSGVSKEELKAELNHPNSIKTYKLMSYHPAVNAPLSLFDIMVSKSRFRFIEPRDATEQEKEQTRIIEEMFHDMEHSMEDFISEVMSFTKFGWSLVEKVFRRRTYSSGSAYNDGLIGLRKLPLRAQESIEKFVFDQSTGNEVVAAKQNLTTIHDPYNQYKIREDNEVVLPRSKFLLFTLGKNRQNPYGTSPVRNVYTAWKYLQAIEELEAQSIVKDINGLPILTLPPQYMSSDATAEQKETYAYYKNLMRNLQQGSQTAAILPSFYDPDTKQPMFKLELLSQDGKKNFDLNKIKEYYRTMIFIGMGADVLLLGNTTAGSFSLGSLKNTLTSVTAESFLKRITQVVNDDLIKQLYILNGWNVARRCKFDYEGVEEIDLESLSKAYQRLGSTGFLPKNLDVVNNALQSIGVDALPESTTQEELDEMLPESKSRSSEGMETPFEGTRKEPGEGDDNANNLENVS